MGDDKKETHFAVNGDGEKTATLTSCDELKSMVSGRPASVTLKVVGWSAPFSTLNGRRKFHCYLANNENYVMRLSIWQKEADEMSEKMKLFSTFRFKNLDLKPIWLQNTPTFKEPNITSSDREFTFNGRNSDALLLASAEKEKYEEYMKQFPGIPPHWKHISEVSSWEKFLAGRVITLTDFEKYKLVVRELGKPVEKSGIYGVAGDSLFNKTIFFVECVAAEEDLALAEFRKGYEFTYLEGRSHLFGSTIWIVIDIQYVSPVSNSDETVNVDEDKFQFVQVPVSSGNAVRKSEVKEEQTSEAPAKRPRKSLV
ncbi:hypothetical protein DdX_09334 [Ditylenchus destructor]|uniref:Uncharacterized protein n=1 Tax=Ditylenchus destructor TaxID=166010 RepID=A0AAD4N4I8_9BILA|nr:hypothetical protein DdX_09334 [Ditylenchus destructor]